MAEILLPSNEEMMKYFCNIKSYDYAIAVYILKYLYLSDCDMYYEMTSMNIYSVNPILLESIYSLEMYIIYNRLGYYGLEAYCDTHFSGTKTRTIADKQYFDHIRILIKEIESYDEVSFSKAVISSNNLDKLGPLVGPVTDTDMDSLGKLLDRSL